MENLKENNEIITSTFIDFKGCLVEGSETEYKAILEFKCNRCNNNYYIEEESNQIVSKFMKNLDNKESVNIGFSCPRCVIKIYNN